MLVKGKESYQMCYDNNSSVLGRIIDSNIYTCMVLGIKYMDSIIQRIPFPLYDKLQIADKEINKPSNAVSLIPCIQQRLSKSSSHVFWQ